MIENMKWRLFLKIGYFFKCWKYVIYLIFLKLESSSWCYKTFFGGILENLDFPLSWNSKNRPFQKQSTILECRFA